MAAQKVRSGWEDLVVAGGVESMSRVPLGTDRGPWACDPETAFDTAFIPQGISADLIATLEGFTREQVDFYAMRSQQRAGAAREAGRFKRSLVPVEDALGDVILDHDEFIRPQTTLEGLAALKTSFDKMGEMGYDSVAIQRYPQVERIKHVHTPGNSSGIVDGAAAVLIGTEEKGKQLGLTPRARIVAVALSGADPTIMLTGPMPAARKALAKAKMQIEQIDLFEINEAFAVVPMKFMKEMNVPRRDRQRERRLDRHGPPARRHRRDDPRHADRRAASAASCATASPRCASAAAWASRRSWSACRWQVLHRSDSKRMPRTSSRSPSMRPAPRSTP